MMTMMMMNIITIYQWHHWGEGAGRGADPPGNTIQGVTPEWNKTFRGWIIKNTGDKRRRKVRVVMRRQLKMVIIFAEGDD